MKSLLRCCALGSCLIWSTTATFGAVIQTPGNIAVSGVINGGLIAPGDVGDTLDYLKFEVLTTTSITITSGFGGGALLLLGQYVGDSQPFINIGNPYRLEQTSSTEWDTLTRVLDPGIYVTAMGVRFNTSYDLGDGFTAVNPEGGAGANGPYSYSISGNVQALQFWDGELNGTFIITNIPEPSKVLLSGMALALFSLRRRRARQP